MAKIFHMLDVVETEGGLGKLGGYSSSNSKRIKSVFPGSPIHSQVVTDQTQTKLYQDDVLDNTEQKGWLFSSFDATYTGQHTTSPLPNIRKDKDFEDALGGPASSYVPNPTSPGAENGIDATKKPAAPKGFGVKSIGAGDPWPKNPGTDGVLSNPSTTSPAIAGVKLGDYILGRSYPVS